MTDLNLAFYQPCVKGFSQGFCKGKNSKKKPVTRRAWAVPFLSPDQARCQPEGSDSGSHGQWDGELKILEIIVLVKGDHLIRTDFFGLPDQGFMHSLLYFTGRCGYGPG